MENKHILILFPDFFRDDYVVDFPGNYSFFRLIRKMANKNRITVVGFGKEKTDHRTRNIRIINLRKKLFFKTNILFFLFYRFWIARRVKKKLDKIPDLVICVLYRVFSVGMLLAKEYHSHIMLRIGGVFNLPERFKHRINRYLSILHYLYYRYSFKAAELIISTFDGSKIDETIKIFRIKEDKVKIFRNGIDYKSCEPNKSSKNILIIARLSKEKGVDLGIEAFVTLRNTYGYDYTLSIIGDGSERHKLEQLARNKKCSESIHFLGYKKDVYPFIKGAKLIWGLFGQNTAIEGISLNRPCIMIDMGNTKELFKNIRLIKIVGYGKFDRKVPRKKQRHIIDDIVKKTIEILDNYDDITKFGKQTGLFKNWDSRINDEIEAINILLRERHSPPKQFQFE